MRTVSINLIEGRTPTLKVGIAIHWSSPELNGKERAGRLSPVRPHLLRSRDFPNSSWELGVQIPEPKWVFSLQNTCLKEHAYPRFCSWLDRFHCSMFPKAFAKFVDSCGDAISRVIRRKI